MKNWRTIATTAAIACALTAPAAIGSNTARADELADLRANQQLLQQRLDQMAQAAAAPGAAVVTAGSFPRSFLIPGTETSLQIAGQGVGSVIFYLHGSATGGALNGQGSFNETFTDGQGGTGNLANIPLNGSQAHARSTWLEFSGKQSQIRLEARTPSPWGVIKGFVSFDFSASNTNTILNVNEGSVNGYIPRFREGYAVVGPLLAGQTWGTMVDLDSAPEVLDFGGQTGGEFVARTPQVRYTIPLPAYGVSLAVAAEQPNPLIAGPFGTFYPDTNQIPTAAACPATTSTTPAPATNVTNACLGNAAFFDPAQQFLPMFAARARWDQAWGHLQLAAAATNYELNDGRYLDKNYEGWSIHITGDVKPWQNVLPGAWQRDDITFGITGGIGGGDQTANNVGLATNYGGGIGVGPGAAVAAFNSTSNYNGPAAARQAYDAAVRARLINSFAARIGYEHFWTDKVRSQVDFSMNHNDVPGALITTNGASGTGAVNKELSLVHVNLIWSPAAFVDTGVEAAWGHRVVVNNTKGDAYTLQTVLKVKF